MSEEAVKTYQEQIVRQGVDSSNIESVGHDPDLNILQVEFKSGTVWQYADVPEDVFADLLRHAEAGDSVGKFFGKNVKPVFKNAAKVYDARVSER